MTTGPLKLGRQVVQNTTFVGNLTPLYVHVMLESAGSVAKAAEYRKRSLRFVSLKPPVFERLPATSAGEV